MMTDQPPQSETKRAEESVESARRLSVNAMHVAVGSLGVVILVMSLALVLTLSLTRSARRDATRLSGELECRSAIVAEQAAADSSLQIFIGQALLEVATSGIGEASLQEVELRVVAIRKTTEAREEATLACSELSK